MASTRPATAAITSLAMTNVERLGVTRNDVVTVLWRNSVVMMSTPRSSANR